MTDAVVLPRRRIVWRGRTYLPGERLALPDEDFDFLAADGFVDVAERGEAVDDAIANRLPAVGYRANDREEGGPARDEAAVDPLEARARRGTATPRRRGASTRSGGKKRV